MFCVSVTGHLCHVTFILYGLAIFCTSPHLRQKTGILFHILQNNVQIVFFLDSDIINYLYLTNYSFRNEGDY